MTDCDKTENVMTEDDWMQRCQEGFHSMKFYMEKYEASVNSFAQGLSWADESAARLISNGMDALKKQMEFLHLASEQHMKHKFGDRVSIDTGDNTLNQSVVQQLVTRVRDLEENCRHHRVNGEAWKAYARSKEYELEQLQKRAPQ